MTARHRSSEFATALARSAERRRCPKCGRKSALKYVSDDFQYGSYCRWCDYERITQRIEP